MGIGGVVAGAVTIVGSWGLGVYLNKRTDRAFADLVRRTEDWITWTREEGKLARLTGTVDGHDVRVENVTAGESSFHDIVVTFRRPLRLGLHLTPKSASGRKGVTVGTGDRRFHKLLRVVADNEEDARRLLRAPLRSRLGHLERDITECTDDHIKLTTLGFAKNASHIIDVLKRFVEVAKLLEESRTEMGTLPHEAAVLHEWRARDDQERLDPEQLKLTTVRRRCPAHATARYLGRDQWQTILEAEPSVTLPAFQIQPKIRLWPTTGAVAFDLVEGYELLAKDATQHQRRAIDALFTETTKEMLREVTQRGHFSADQERFTLTLDGRLRRDALDKELSALVAMTAALSEQLRGAGGLYR